ncbi:uncharacterized protein LOC131947464 [Physella acuta]|uniref:uncharacterized protein LOC131947464 n=1 Tax=Physella acuta TaxID=109671 RepID=UPI0027DD11C5|nr:uncharacterized protein LOC131947464 [Physella acuta]
MTTSAICTHIVKGLEHMWSDQMLFDFTVKIEDETIKCHRLILAACSDFFQALFRSGMREVTENCVVLQEVSCDVFTLILRTLYTGVDILTSQNLLDVWRAVHMLQISFMVKLCEDFAIETVTMDTWEKVYTNAKLLDSEYVLEHLQKFMIKNFEQISLTSTFLQLSFDELRNLIKCQDLVVSKEDLVLEGVIRWVNFVQIMPAELKESKCTLNVCQDEDSNKVDHMILDSSGTTDFVKNEIALRKEKLTGLLKKIRIYLVSPSLLSHVYKMDLISENKDSSDIIVDALLYHVQDLRQSHWPSGALHRTCSGYTYGGVFAQGNGHLKFISAIEEKIYTISYSSWLYGEINLTTVNGELYAASRPNYPFYRECNIHVFSDTKWNLVTKLKCHNFLFFSRRDCIYILNKDTQEIYEIKPKDDPDHIHILTQFAEDIKVTHVIALEYCILLFCSETQNGLEETAVHTFDILSKVWTRLDNLDGPAEHLISFKNGTHNYILQANGSLCLVLYLHDSRKIEFEQIANLWTWKTVLHGAFTYKKKLIIVGYQSQINPDGEQKLEVPNHFKLIKHWQFFCTRSNVAPLIIPTASLRENSYYY